MITNCIILKFPDRRSCAAGKYIFIYNTGCQSIREQMLGNSDTTISF